MIRTVGQLRRALKGLNDSARLVVQYKGNPATVERTFVSFGRTEKTSTYLTAQGQREAVRDEEPVKKLRKPVFVVDIG